MKLFSKAIKSKIGRYWRVFTANSDQSCLTKLLAGENIEQGLISKILNRFYNKFLKRKGSIANHLLLTT